MENQEVYEAAAQYYMLTGKDLARLIKVSIATANRRIKVVKDRFSISKYTKISLYQYYGVFIRGNENANNDLKSLMTI